MKNTNTFLSYHQLLFPIILTEFLRRASLLPLEHTIEIGQIVEAAVIAHLCNGTRGIYQHTRGKAQTDINNVVGKRLAGAQAKETAERDRGQQRRTLALDLLLQQNKLISLTHFPIKYF